MPRPHQEPKVHGDAASNKVFAVCLSRQGITSQQDPGAFLAEQTLENKNPRTKVLVINDGTPDLQGNSILLLNPAEKAKLRRTNSSHSLTAQQASMSLLLPGKPEVKVIQ